MDPFELVNVAVDLVERGVEEGAVRPEYMKRATSTLYYAMFHCLSRSHSDVLAGIGGGEAWARVYRAMDHGYAAKRCRDSNGLAVFAKEIQQFANLFCMAQEDRIQADYNPRFAGKPLGTVIFQSLAVRATMLSFNGVAADSRRDFALYLLIKNRT